MTISGPKTSGSPSVVINAQNRDSVFVINNIDLKVKLKYLLIENGNAINGGGINNNGNLTVYNCTFQCNTASESGGAISNWRISTVTNCTFLNNTASGGGAIFNFGYLNVTSSKFQYNTANAGSYARGGAVFTANGAAYINFCRIFENNPNTSQIYSAAFVDPTIITDLNLNWWGSNDNPSTKFESPLAVTWLVLKISETPNIIPYGGYTTVKADFQYDNLNKYHDPKIMHLPNDEIVYFTGDGSFKPLTPSLTNGSVSSIFTPNTLGLSHIWTIFDNLMYPKNVTVFPPLKVINTNPKNGSLNIPPTNVVKVTFSKPIKEGNMWIELKKDTKTLIPIKRSINGNVLTITYNSMFTNGRYSLILHTGSLTDLNGNPLIINVNRFTVDSLPPKVSTTTPTTNKTGISRSSSILLKFTENIKSSIYYNKINIKNLATGKFITLTNTVSGRYLSLKTTTRSANTWYQVTIPKAAIKDYANNNLLVTYTFKFKTGP